MILRVLRFFALRIFLNDLPVEFLRIFAVAELPLTVRREQHHFGPHFLGHVVFAPRIIGHGLRILPALIFEPEQADGSDAVPTPAFRKCAAFFQ